MTDIDWDFESDFVDIDMDTEGKVPMLNMYFNFPISLNITVEQAEILHKGLSTCLSKIRPQKSSDLSDNSS